MHAKTDHAQASPDRTRVPLKPDVFSHEPCCSNAQELTIAAGHRADNPERIAALIFQTAPRNFDYMFGSDKTSCMAFLADQWASEYGTYSHCRALVARVGKQIVGLEIGGTVDEWKNCGNAQAEEDLCRSVNENVAASALNRFCEASERLAAMMLMVAPETYYIQTLSVDDHFQGKGVGSKLLSSALANARLRRLTACDLDVAVTNPAQKLYLKFGFRQVAKSKILGVEKQAKIPSMVRMSRPL